MGILLKTYSHKKMVWEERSLLLSFASKMVKNITSLNIRISNLISNASKFSVLKWVVYGDGNNEIKKKKIEAVCALKVMEALSQGCQT